MEKVIKVYEINELNDKNKIFDYVEEISLI